MHIKTKKEFNMFHLMDKYEDEFKLKRILTSFYNRVSSEVNVKHFFMDLSLEKMLQDVDHYNQFILDKPDRIYTAEPSQTADSSTQIGSSSFKEICHHLVEVLKEEAIQEEDIPRFVTDVMEIVEESKAESSDRISTVYEAETLNYEHLVEILAKARTKAELDEENVLTVRVSGVQVPINIKINKKHQYLLIFGKVECKTHDQKALDEIINKANIVVIGEKTIFEEGNKISGKSHNLKVVESFDQINFESGDKFFLDISNGKNHKYKLSECSKESGESVLDSLNLALDLAKENKIDAINFGPFNKTSLKLGGNKFSDELHLMAEKLEVKNFFCEFNVVDNFWTARVTSHIPISEVPSHIKKEKIIKPIKLINEAMKLNGVKKPRVAVQALNPHAEFGTEEKDEIIPAIEEAKKLGINADGPLPCDTSFITAYKNKNHDCIVGMYHDALQSGLKAFGFDRGVTVQGGLPVPITTPAHGTAFDIAGKNEANLEPTLNSFKIALTMAENKNKA